MKKSKELKRLEAEQRKAVSDLNRARINKWDMQNHYAENFDSFEDNEAYLEELNRIETLISDCEERVKKLFGL